MLVPMVVEETGRGDPPLSEFHHRHVEDTLATTPLDAGMTLSNTPLDGGRVFVTAHTAGGSVEVLENTVDFSVSGRQITFLSAPPNGYVHAYYETQGDMVRRSETFLAEVGEAVEYTETLIAEVL